MADTELLFTFNPRDPRYKGALRIIEELRGKLYVPDVALLEFEIVLKSRGKSQDEIKQALLALKRIFTNYDIKEVNTVNTIMLINHLELMTDYGLSYFDSLIASATLLVDGVIVSDDPAFDKVEGLRRIPISARLDC